MVTFTAGQPIDFGQFSFVSVFGNDASFANEQPSSFEIRSDPAGSPYYVATVTGDAFDYSNDVPSNGLIKTFTIDQFDNNDDTSPELVFSLTNLKIGVQTFESYLFQDPYAVANKIFAGNDIFNGSGGDDFMAGFRGNDKLTGGGGDDSFYFNLAPTPGNVDFITDFSHQHDHIVLDHNIFKGVSNAKMSTQFHDITPGLKYEETDDRILYDRDTGVLSYDPDGKSGHPPKTIAVLKADAHGNHPSIDYHDILVL